MWVNNFKFSKKPCTDAKYGCDCGRRLLPVDHDDRHAARARDVLLAAERRFPGEQGWYINVGDKEGTTAEYFSLSSIISAAR